MKRFIASIITLFTAVSLVLPANAVAFVLDETEITEPPAGFEYEIQSDENGELVNPFSDVDPYSPEGRAAIQLYYREILGGYPDGTMRLDDFVNRAEVAKYIANALYGGVVPDYGSEDNPGMMDLDVTQWYYDFVVAMFEAQIFHGYPDGYFRADQYINAAEMSKVLTNSFNLIYDEYLDMYHGGDYTDYLKHVRNVSESVIGIDGNSWYAPYVWPVVVNWNLFPDRYDDFRPAENVTRGELAYAIEKILSTRGGNGWTKVDDEMAFIEYEGSVVLTGWMVQQSAYVGDPVPHFHVAEESVYKIPGVLRGYNLRLSDGVEYEFPADMVSQLEGSSAENPATIVVTRLEAYIEGSPTLTVEDIL